MIIRFPQVHNTTCIWIVCSDKIKIAIKHFLNPIPLHSAVTVFDCTIALPQLFSPEFIGNSTMLKNIDALDIRNIPSIHTIIIEAAEINLAKE